MAAGPQLVKIYTQIVTALLPVPGGEGDIAAFLSNTIRLAPFHLRMGVRVAETALLLWLVCTVKGFVTGTPDNIGLRASLTRFEKLSGLCATLPRLYRSLIMLAWCERQEAAP
jgi:hypothetical protein